jgi:hypothetical protein
MPNLPSFAAASIGCGAAVGMSALTYVFQAPWVLSLVYSTYAGLVVPELLLFEVAWLLATIDRLLDLSVSLSLVLWIALAILVTLSVRDPAGVFKVLGAAVLLLGGTWLLFAYKYAAVSGLGILLLPFLVWRLLLTLCLTWVTAGVLVLPFWLKARRVSEAIPTPTAVRFVCQGCGAEYSSNPSVCVRCGAEGAIRKKPNRI